MRLAFMIRFRSTLLLTLICLMNAGVGLAQAGGGTLSRDSGASATSARHTTERARPPARRPPTQTRVVARSAEAYNNQGEEFLNAGKYELAIEAFRHAIRLKSQK